MTGLLVSVRSADEAEIALAGGATIIDVKEPSRGPLGRADAEVIAEVVKTVNGRRPVSAALGELHAFDDVAVPDGLAFVKLGLAEYAERDNWRNDWRNAASVLTNDTKPVVVAYADYALAQAPPIDDVVDFACRIPDAVFLIDTFHKGSGDERKSLLDWISVDGLQSICAKCRAAEVRIALAGSLTMEEAPTIRKLNADWMAVRGAVCGEQQRGNAIELQRVRELAMRLGLSSRSVV